MKKLVESLMVALCLFVPFQISYGQQAETPVYKDGDWWRVKVETVFKPGVSRSGRCDESYPEYLVKIDQGKPMVFSVSGNKEGEIDCPTIVNELLNVGQEAGRYLKFPLALNSTWRFQGTGQGPRGPIRFDENHKVLAWEKVQGSKGELDAFKIEASYATRGGDALTAYYYSPKAKCIVSFKLSTPAVDRTVTLADFSLAQ
jgi:hypothetical protein